MKGYQKIIVFGASLLVVLSFLFSYYTWYQMKRVVVVDAIRLVNEFDLKKILEKEVAKKNQFYTEKLDSLKYIIESSDAGKLKDNALILYDRIQNDLASSVEISNQNINEQVWKRLNPLIDKFGKEYGYRTIIGANGMGSVLYIDGTMDITNALIKYVNKHYATGG